MMNEIYPFFSAKDPIHFDADPVGQNWLILRADKDIKIYRN